MRETAAASGISTSFLSRLEGGQIKRPAEDVLLGLARGLGVDPRVIRGDLNGRGQALPVRSPLPLTPEPEDVDHLIRVALPMVRKILATAGAKDVSRPILEQSARELVLVILKELDLEHRHVSV